MLVIDRVLRSVLVLMVAVFCLAATYAAVNTPSAANCYETYQPNLGWFESLPDICEKGDCTGDCEMKTKYRVLGFELDGTEVPVLEIWDMWCECDGKTYCHATSSFRRQLFPETGEWYYVPGTCVGDCGGDTCFNKPGSGPNGQYKTGDRLCGCS